jgi:hypothetical protein
MDASEAREAIHTRLSQGASLGEVKRQIVDHHESDLRGALWLYAASQPEVLGAIARPVIMRKAAVDA